MELITFFYDNFLIYNPNIFFSIVPLLFLVVVIWFFQWVPYLYLEIKKVNLSIGIYGKKSHTARRELVSSAPVLALFRFIYFVEKTVGNIQIKMEKILNAIRKEIFIDE